MYLLGYTGRLELNDASWRQRLGADVLREIEEITMPLICSELAGV